jgi:hypothetical protein
LPFFVERQLGGQLVEVRFQLGVELRSPRAAEKAAQAPAGDDDRRGDPEQGSGQQADAQRAARGK